MNKLEEEIERIKYELAVTIPEELQNATDATDSTEMSDYSEILTRQNLLSIRLSQLIKRLNAVRHVDLKNIPKNSVGIGSLVTLFSVEENTSIKVKIISSEISDSIDEAFEEITLNSPIGKALLDKQLHDDVLVSAPAGIKHYKIIDLVTIHHIKT